MTSWTPGQFQSRNRRVAEYQPPDDAPEGVPMEVLSEDSRGTYKLPFPARKADGVWLNAQTGEPIETPVLGCRPWTGGAP